MCSEPVKVMEGKEPQEFWAAVGGKTEYASGKLLEVGLRLSLVSDKNVDQAIMWILNTSLSCLLSTSPLLELRLFTF